MKNIPETVSTPAYSADGEAPKGTWFAELTGLLDLTGWPKGVRVIVRKECPNPGAQPRITDIDGLRVTAFATNIALGQLPDLELRQRPRPVRGPDPQSSYPPGTISPTTHHSRTAGSQDWVMKVRGQRESLAIGARSDECCLPR